MKRALGILLSDRRDQLRSASGPAQCGCRRITGEKIMTRKLIASLIALGIIGGIATSASAHLPKPTPVASEPFKDFWEQQQRAGGY